MRSRNLKDLVHFDEGSVRRETLYETGKLWSEVLCFDSKQFIGPMEDLAADAIFTVLAGEGRFIVGRRSRSVRQWGSVLVPAGSEVSVHNVSDEPMVVLLVASPPPIAEHQDGEAEPSFADEEEWEDLDGPDGDGPAG